MFSETKFVCQVCNRNYTSKNVLYQHMKIYKKSKEFKCDICLKAFSYKKILKDIIEYKLEKNRLLVKYIIESWLKNVI